MAKVALIGAGKMGEALLVGMLREGHQALVAESDPERAAQLAEFDGVHVCSAAEAVASADLILVAVKPPQVVPLIAELAPSIATDAPVISVAAGISNETLSGAAGPRVAVIRAMPNTPALVGQGMIALSPGDTCNATQTALAIEVLSSVGEVVVVPEGQQDAVTALSGSGPAYIFLVAEAMAQAGVELGLDPETAAKLTTQTIFGAASMLRESGEDSRTLRRNVTSPNGTTAAAIDTFERNRLRSIFQAAMTAARDRSIEMSSE